jgi:hypothetical protein
MTAHEVDVHPPEGGDVEGGDIRPGDRDHIDVADTFVETARNGGPVEVEPNEFVPENGAEVRNQRPDDRGRRIIVGH